ncbi:hypothetical protein [Chitinophaga ginsengisoli]|uniref:Uncharacterized protein n=1 Tax=Chitinophaga ginsengisoli TaxID=363837 RepID=A0A2P8FXI0_9BACT|nr:hypothetical protein [Chitinophaga ginsengisoli]PSL26430.1 hypothetical protein CLV42_111143 [Chitinophaga ginsengisoli]
MLALTTLCLLFISTKGQDHTLYHSVHQNLDSNFIISASYKPLSKDGVVILEENHMNQYNAINQLLSISKNNKGEIPINKIVLEGLYYPLRSKVISFDAAQIEERQIYLKLLKSLVINEYNYDDSSSISNAEFLHLGYGFELLPSENPRDYQACKELSDSPLIYLLNMNYFAASTAVISTEQDIENLEYYFRSKKDNNSLYKRCYDRQLNFLKLVSKRTDTIAYNTKNHYEKYKRVFCIEGMRHTSLLTARLEQQNIPYVVITEKVNLVDTRRTLIKPTLKIDQFRTKLYIEKEYLKCLLANAESKGVKPERYFSFLNVKKILDQFEIVKNPLISDGLLSFDVHSNEQQLYYKDQINIGNLPDIYYSMVKEPNEDPSSMLTAPIVKQTILKDNLSFKQARESIYSTIKTYLDSDLYRSKSNFLKYHSVEGGPSKEIHWSDNILFNKIKDLDLNIQAQCSKAKNNRPDWYYEGNEGNLIGEVKYIRNRATFSYVKKLLVNDQIESYLKDPRLNAQALDLYILIDEEGLKKQGVKIEQINIFKRMLDLRMRKLNLSLEKNINVYYLIVIKNFKYAKARQAA